MRSHSFGRVMVLACSVVFPITAAIAQEKPSFCEANNIRIVKKGPSKLRFCIKGDLWLEAESGTSFGRMARLCCKNPEVIEKVWKNSYKEAQKDLWYPLKKTLLDDAVLARLEPDPPEGEKKVEEVEEEETPEVTPPNDDDHEKRVEGEKTPGGGPEKTPGGGPEKTPGGDPEETPDGGHEKKTERYFLYAISLISLLTSIVVATVTFMGKRTKKTKLGYATVSDPVDKSRPTTLGKEDAEKMKELSLLLVEPLAEAMRQAVEKAFSQKVTLEIAPPTSRISEWVSFLRSVKEELDRSPSGSARGGGAGVYNGVRPTGDPGVAQSPLSDKKPFPPHRVYVELQIDYKDGSVSLGGRPIFQETTDHHASFCVEPVSREEGWLRPNPDARTYDNAYHQFFGIGKSDFPIKGESKSQKVRCEGGQWVLASPSW